MTWLLAANEFEAQQRKLFRNATEEQEMLLMRRPVTTQKAYALFGLLLGALPPAAIFGKMLVRDPYSHTLKVDAAMFFLYLFMNVVSTLVGYLMGQAVSRTAYSAERGGKLVMLFVVGLCGALWGLVTGGVSGGLYYFYGALIGAYGAMPFTIVAFLVFAILHRTLERGGMIETRHFLPLACGITLTIAAFIFGW